MQTPAPSPSNPSEPSPFLLTGAIEDVDVRARRLRIAAQVLDVIVPVSLAGLQVGDPVVVRGIRDPATGRALVIEIVRALRPGAAERPDGLSIQGRIMALVVSLLAELCQEVDVLECSLLPGDDRYALRLEIPGDMEKAILVPRRMLECALLDSAARCTVRNVLHSAIRVLRSQRAISDSRTCPPDGLHMWTGPRCVACERPLFAEEPILVEEGTRRHLSCPTMSSPPGEETNLTVN
jgi:hypothetical protein